MHQRFHGQAHAVGQSNGPLSQQPQQLLGGDEDHLFGQRRQNQRQPLLSDAVETGSACILPPNLGIKVNLSKQLGYLYHNIIIFPNTGAGVGGSYTCANVYRHRQHTSDGCLCVQATIRCVATAKAGQQQANTTLWYQSRRYPWSRCLHLRGKEGEEGMHCNRIQEGHLCILALKQLQAGGRDLQLLVFIQHQQVLDACKYSETR